MKAMEGTRRRGEVGSPPWPYLIARHLLRHVHTHDPVALDAFISPVVDAGSIFFSAGTAWQPATASPRAE